MHAVIYSSAFLYHSQVPKWFISCFYSPHSHTVEQEHQGNGNQTTSLPVIGRPASTNWAFMMVKWFNTVLHNTDLTMVLGWTYRKPHVWCQFLMHAKKTTLCCLTQSLVIYQPNPHRVKSLSHGEVLDQDEEKNNSKLKVDKDNIVDRKSTAIAHIYTLIKFELNWIDPWNQ